MAIWGKTLSLFLPLKFEPNVIYLKKLKLLKIKQYMVIIKTLEKYKYKKYENDF